MLDSTFEIELCVHSRKSHSVKSLLWQRLSEEGFEEVYLRTRQESSSYANRTAPKGILREISYWATTRGDVSAQPLKRSLVFCCEKAWHESGVSEELTIIVLGICDRLYLLKEVVSKNGSHEEFLNVENVHHSSGQTRFVSIEIAPSKSFSRTFDYLFNHKIGLWIEFVINPKGNAFIFRSESVKDLSLIDVLKILPKKIWSRCYEYIWRRLISSRVEPDYWNIEIRGSECENQFSKNVIGRYSNHADPFVRKDGRGNIVVIFESWLNGDIGRIRALSLNPFGKMVDYGVIIEADTHMSFPFTFQYGDSCIMYPQTGRGQTQPVYIATDFPKNWTHSFDITLPVSLVDIIVFKHEGTWWLMGSARDPYLSQRSNRLMCYHAESPLSVNWIAHEGNPVAWSDKFGRNGGDIFQDSAHDSLIRVAQRHGADEYGRGLEFRRIKILSVSNFEDEESPPLDHFWGPERSGHHFSWTFDGSWTARDFRGRTAH